MKPISGLKGGATQAGGNKKFKDLGASGQRMAKKTTAGNAGNSAPTEKGRNPFKAQKQEAAFTNPAGVMKGAGHTNFIN